MRSLVVYNNKYVNFSSWRSKKGKNPGGGVRRCHAEIGIRNGLVYCTAG